MKLTSSLQQSIPESDYDETIEEYEQSEFQDDFVAVNEQDLFKMLADEIFVAK